MEIPANNRQLKLLRHFGVSNTGMSGLAAREAIRTIWADPANQDRWNRYVYLTGDLASEAPDLKPFDPDTLERVVLPDRWSASTAEREYRKRVALEILKDQLPYDNPPPAVVLPGHVFCFTGRFAYGTRARCEAAVLERGGVVFPSDYVTHVVHYVAVGVQGSDRWKCGDYGSKIEGAVVERAVHGQPALISESHWCSFL